MSVVPAGAPLTQVRQCLQAWGTQELPEESSYMRAGHVGRWRELPSLAQAALQQPRTGPGSPEGTRGYSNPHCHSTTEADWLRESHRQPGLPVWLATHSLRRAEARHLTPSPAPCGLTRANDDSAPVQVMGSVFTGMLRKIWHVKKTQKTTTRTNHS